MSEEPVQTAQQLLSQLKAEKPLESHIVFDEKNRVFGIGDKDAWKKSRDFLLEVRDFLQQNQSFNIEPIKPNHPFHTPAKEILNTFPDLLDLFLKRSQIDFKKLIQDRQDDEGKGVDTVAMERVVFPGDVAIQDIQGVSSVIFRECQFLGSFRANTSKFSTFSAPETIFKGPTVFYGADFGSIALFRETHFADETSFHFCKFGGGADFSDCFFEKLPDFVESISDIPIRFDDVLFPLGEKGAAAAERYQAMRNYADSRGDYQLSSLIYKSEVPARRGAIDKLIGPKRDKIMQGRRDRIAKIGLDSKETPYRNEKGDLLKKDAQNSRIANGNSVLALLGPVFGIVSDYGRSIWLPFFWLLFSIAVFMGLYQLVVFGFKPSGQFKWELARVLATLSLENAFPFVPRGDIALLQDESRKNVLEGLSPGWKTALFLLNQLQKLVSLILYFLIGFAVRKAVKLS